MTEPGAKVICFACRFAGGAHDDACPIPKITEQLEEITGNLAAYVVSVRDSLDAIRRVLRNERDDV